MNPSFRELRAAIANAPDDLGVRQVFADLLTERGDPRGAFITAQCQGNETAASELLARYRIHFMHPLPPAAEVVFRNGFVEAWKTDAAGFRKSGRRILRQAPVRELAITWVSLGDVKYVLESPGIERLRSLELLNVRANVLSVLTKEALPSLRRLAVTNVTAEAAESFRSSQLFEQLERFEAQQPRAFVPPVTQPLPPYRSPLSRILRSWAKAVRRAVL